MSSVAIDRVIPLFEGSEIMIYNNTGENLSKEKMRELAAKAEVMPAPPGPGFKEIVMLNKEDHHIRTQMPIKMLDDMEKACNYTGPSMFVELEKNDPDLRRKIQEGMAAGKSVILRATEEEKRRPPLTEEQKDKLIFGSGAAFFDFQITDDYGNTTNHLLSAAEFKKKLNTPGCRIAGSASRRF